MPFDAIAELPRHYLLAALSARITATDDGRPHTACNCFPGAAALACSRANAAASSSACGSPAVGAALDIRNTTCCAAARILFHAALLSGPLRHVTLYCTTTPSGSLPCGGRDSWFTCCPCTGHAVAALLRAHAATLQSLTLCGVSITGEGGVALAAALQDSKLRLRSLSLHGVKFGERSDSVGTDALTEAVHACTALNHLSLAWPWAPDRHHRRMGWIDLSRLPHLRTLAMASVAAWQRWVAVSADVENFRQLEDLTVDLSENTLASDDGAILCRRIMNRLKHCVCLRRLSGVSVGLLQAMQLWRTCFPELTSVQACVTRFTGTMPLLWLQGCPRLEDISIRAERNGAEEVVVELDIGSLASRLAAKTALTRLELQGFRLVNCASDWEAGDLVNTLANLPQLEVLRLREVVISDPPQPHAPASVAAQNQRGCGAQHCDKVCARISGRGVSVYQAATATHAVSQGPAAATAWSQVCVAACMLETELRPRVRACMHCGI